MGEGDNVAARGRGDAASGRVEGRTLKERLIARMNPSYAHRLPSGRFIPGWRKHASGTRYTMRWTSGRIAGAARAATSEGRQQLQLTFSLVPGDQREEPGFATLDYREPFAVGEAVPRAVVDMCDRSARSRERQQERARLTAEHLTIRIQHVGRPARTKDQIVRNGAGIDCHWSGFVGGPAFAVQLHSERCRGKRAMDRREFAVACFQCMRWTARFAEYRNDLLRRRSRARGRHDARAPMSSRATSALT